MDQALIPPSIFAPGCKHGGYGTSVGGSVQEKDVNDIMFAVKEMDRRDTSETTVFVATRLDGLPRVTPGEVDPISLLERVTLLETSMRNVQQCVTRHDSALAAVTRTATRNSHNTSASSAVETMAPTSRTDATYDHGACDTSASSAVETMAPTSRTDAAHDHGAYDTSASPAIETMANASPTDATTKPSWSTVAASRDKFVVPKYHEKKAARKQPATLLPTKRKKPTVFYGTKSSDAIKSAPRRLELFVFNVDASIDDEHLREFIASEHVDVLELERMSKEEAWTQSFRVLVTAPNPRCTLDNDFWPHGIGCRQYYRKRPNTRNTPDDTNM